MSCGHVVKAYRFPRSLLATTHFVCSHIPLSPEIPARCAVSIVGTRNHVRSVSSNTALSKCPTSPTSPPSRGSTNCSSYTLSPVRHHTCAHSAALAYMLTSSLASTIMPAVMAWLVPGAAWFHHQLIPDGTPSPNVLTDARTTMAIWQLGNCEDSVRSR